MIVSAHQPAHLPWLGYLDKIARSDVFVYLDDVQFEKNSFTNRNRIKTPQGIAWLTVPLHAKGHLSGTIRDLRIDDSRPWRLKQLKTIEVAYRRAPAFEAVFTQISAWIADPTPVFADYCWQQLQGWVAQAGLSTRLIRASSLGLVSRKSDLVLDICRSLGATRYLSGALGAGYLAEADFADAGITIEYQAFDCPPYPQLWGDFVPTLSALDYWMNLGRLPDFDRRAGFNAGSCGPA